MYDQETHIQKVLSNNDPEIDRHIYADYLEEQGNIQSTTLRACTEICFAEKQQLTHILQQNVQTIIQEYTEAAVLEGLEELGLKDIHVHTGITASISVEDLKQHMQDICIFCPHFDALNITDITQENAELLPELLSQHTQFQPYAQQNCITKLAEHIPNQVNKAPYSTSIIFTSLRVGGLKAKEIIPAIEAAGMYEYSTNHIIQNSEEFTIPVNKREKERNGHVERINLITLKIRDLGIENAQVPLEFLGEFAEGNFVQASHLQELGLKLCPPEIGPYLRLADVHQKEGGWYSIGMQPITSPGGDMFVFECGRNSEAVLIDTYSADSEYMWILDDGIVFCLRTSEIEEGRT